MRDLGSSADSTSQVARGAARLLLLAWGWVMVCILGLLRVSLESWVPPAPNLSYSHTVMRDDWGLVEPLKYGCFCSNFSQTR
jgi:hypothetical protein